MRPDIQPGEIRYEDAPITWRWRYRLGRWLFTRGYGAVGFAITPAPITAPEEERSR